jgi:parallel beta-helix repeat protein
MRIRQYKTVLAGAVATLAFGLFAVMQFTDSQAASSAVTCTRLASSSGSDSAAGTPSAPWRTATKLLSSLQAGDVGCFAGGQTFGSADVEDMVAASDVTITSAPGGTPATLVGLLYLQGSRITVTGLRLDGHNSFSEASNGASVQGQAGIFVVGDDLRIVGNDISNGHTAICVGVGNPPAKPQRALIDGNRIHACGVLPQTHGEHGIYLGHGTGTTISNNIIYDIADFGIQLYPDATNTTVQNNIVSGTGEVGGIVIGAEGGTPSSGTTIRRNIITHTKGLAITTYWGGAVGSGNVATDNCTADTAAQVQVAGLTVTSQKVVADAGLDANFMLNAGSACLGYGPASSQPGGSVSPPPPAAPPAAPKPPPAGGTTPPRGGQAAPVTPTGGVTATGGDTHASGAAGIAITSPLTGGTLAAGKPGATVKTFRFVVKWKGKAGKTYQLRVDKGHWFSVKGRTHTFKHLRAGKHTVALRLKGSHGKGTKSVITVG